VPERRSLLAFAAPRGLGKPHPPLPHGTPENNRYFPIPHTPPQTPAHRGQIGVADPSGTFQSPRLLQGRATFGDGSPDAFDGARIGLTEGGCVHALRTCRA